MCSACKVHCCYSGSSPSWKELVSDALWHLPFVIIWLEQLLWYTWVKREKFHKPTDFSLQMQTGSWEASKVFEQGRLSMNIYQIKAAVCWALPSGPSSALEPDSNMQHSPCYSTQVWVDVVIQNPSGHINSSMNLLFAKASEPNVGDKPDILAGFGGWKADDRLPDKADGYKRMAWIHAGKNPYWGGKEISVAWRDLIPFRTTSTRICQKSHQTCKFSDLNTANTTFTTC